MINKEVLNGIKYNGTLLDIIVKRKGDWIGHIIRRKGIQKSVFEGTVEMEVRRVGKRLRRRARHGSQQNTV